MTGCSILSMWIFAFSIVQLDLAMKEGEDFVTVLGKYPASIALIVYAFFIGLSLSGLNFMHVVQIGKGYTTHENVSLEWTSMFLVEGTDVYPFSPDPKPSKRPRKVSLLARPQPKLPLDALPPDLASLRRLGKCPGLSVARG